MAKCASHQQGKTPMFLRYVDCEECEQIHLFRIKSAATRKAVATRANRRTAQINGQPATMRVRSFPASSLPKSDPWYRPRMKGGK